MVDKKFNKQYNELIMARTYTRTAVTFVAGEAAPNAVEVFENRALVPNIVGSMALAGFRENYSANRLSKAQLDLATTPPTLHMKNVLAVVLFGEREADTGKFKVWNVDDPVSIHYVNGSYNGPGSELTIDYTSYGSLDF